MEKNIKPEQLAFAFLDQKEAPCPSEGQVRYTKDVPRGTDSSPERLSLAGQISTVPGTDIQYVIEGFTEPVDPNRVEVSTTEEAKTAMLEGKHPVLNDPGNPFDGFPILSVYDDEDALGDGALVDAEKIEDEGLIRAIQFPGPILFLRKFYEECINPTKEEAGDGQSIKGRVWDIVSIWRFGRLLPRLLEKKELYFKMIVWKHREGGKGHQHTYTMRAILDDTNITKIGLHDDEW